MKAKYLISLMLASFFYTSGIAQKSNQITENQIVEIDKLVDGLSLKDSFSGNVLIAKGDEILYQKAVGMANKEQNTKNNIETKFNLASMNKMFTGVAIAQLVEKNKLSFSDKVANYLPNLSKKTYGKVTIEQLLTHTSGAGDIFSFPEFMEMKDTAKTIASYVKLGINEPLLFEPGLRFEYSNYGYILLGAIIEKVAQMSYYDYVKKNIFDVAKMNNSDSYEADKVNNNLAIGYAMTPEITSQREPNIKFIEVKGTSAGGGYSTVNDLHMFSQALFAGKLISQNSVDIITNGKILMPMPPMPPNAKPVPDRKYGYGFGELFKNNIRVVEHNGGAPGVDVYMKMYPDLGYTLIVLSNYDIAVRPIVFAIDEIITVKQ